MLQCFVEVLTVLISTAAITGGPSPAVAEGQPAPAPAAGPGRPGVVEMKPAHEADAADAQDGRKGYLGAVIGAVPDELRAHLDLPERGGLVITRVAEGSPAERAGLEANDILLEYGDRGVSSPLEFAEMVEATKAGERVRLTVVHRGKRRNVGVVIETRRPVAGEDGRPAAGLPGMPPGAVGGLALAQAAGGAGGSRMQTSTITINGRTQTITVASNDSGTIEIRGTDGKRTVSIHDAEGKAVHAGPLDREADFKAVPEAWRQRVRDVEAGSRGGRPGAIRGDGEPL